MSTTTESLETKRIPASKLKVGDRLMAPFCACKVLEVDHDDYEADGSIGVKTDAADQWTWLHSEGLVTVNRELPAIPYGTIVRHDSGLFTYGLVVKTEKYGWISVVEDNRFSHWDDNLVRSLGLDTVYTPETEESL